MQVAARSDWNEATGVAGLSRGTSKRGSPDAPSSASSASSAAHRGATRMRRKWTSSL
jgi:hypothetical protein